MERSSLGYFCACLSRSFNDARADVFNVVRRAFVTIVARLADDAQRNDSQWPNHRLASTTRPHRSNQEVDWRQRIESCTRRMTYRIFSEK